MRASRLLIPVWALGYLLLALLATPVTAQPADSATDPEQTLGETDFPNSGAAEAQAPFLRGLLLLHSFEYADARAAFQEALRTDPDFAMAAWGEAMTHNHPIWMDQDQAAAQAALERLGATPAERLAAAPTERERAYLRAAEALFFADATKEERDDAFAESMAELAAAYPDDLDAAAFHALAVLGTAHEGRDFATYMRAAALAEEVFDANPRHPGAAHYLIHAYDDPVHAPLGLRPARVYAEIAPAASHALHMPSHIYFALGDWDRGAVMNERSHEAAAAKTTARGEPLNGHGWHALYWLHYAYLQQGRYAAAEEILERVAAMAEADPTGRAPWMLRAMRGHHVVETADGDGAWAQREIPAPEPSLVSDVQDRFARGLAALHREDVTEAEQALAGVQAALAEADAEARRTVPLRILALELEALLDLHAGAAADAFARAEEAAALEDTMPIEFGPPDPVKPAHELYGEVLLALDRPAEAQAQFEAVLERYPRRTRALLGLAEAAARVGDAATAAEARAEVEAIWHAADPGVRAGWTPPTGGTR